MRSSLNFGTRIKIAKCGALFLSAFFWSTTESVFAENGKLGGISTASTGLILVVPEHFQPLTVDVQDNKLTTCGFVSEEVSFLSINGENAESLQPKPGASNCNGGQTFISSVSKEGTTIFVPSSAL